MTARLSDGPLRLDLWSDSDMLRWFDPFAGDKESPGVQMPPRCVRVRKVQVCKAGMEWHDIPVGARALYYRLIDNGKWLGAYFCEECVVDWLTYCGIRPRAAALNEEADGN